MSRRQLLQLGLTEGEIRGRVRSGTLQRLHRAVFGFGDVRPKGHLLAAQLALGPDAVLSHRSAAAIHELRPINRYAIELTVPGSGGRARDGLIVHRTRTAIDRREVTTRLGLRGSSYPRMLVELALRETAGELERLITLGVRKQLFDAAAVESAVHRHAHRPGLARLQAAIARYRPGPDRKSGLERSVDRWLATRPDVPPPERNVRLGIWEIDCLWRAQGVALELDGRPYHIAVCDFDKDGYKDAQLQLLGLRPIRVSDFRWEYDRAAVIADLLALLGVS